MELSNGSPDTQTPGATPRKDFRILEFVRRVNEKAVLAGAGQDRSAVFAGFRAETVPQRCPEAILVCQSGPKIVYTLKAMREVRFPSKLLTLDRLRPQRMVDAPLRLFTGGR